MVQVVAIVSC